MKRLSKMAYELRDITIFYERTVKAKPVREIAMIHGRSISRINQLLRVQAIKFKHYRFTRDGSSYRKTIPLSILSRYIIRNFYHYEIGLILQRYYIRMKK